VSVLFPEKLLTAKGIQNPIELLGCSRWHVLIFCKALRESQHPPISAVAMDLEIVTTTSEHCHSLTIMAPPRIVASEGQSFGLDFTGPQVMLAVNITNSLTSSRSRNVIRS